MTVCQRTRPGPPSSHIESTRQIKRQCMTNHPPGLTVPTAMVYIDIRFALHLHFHHPTNQTCQEVKYTDTCYNRSAGDFTNYTKVVFSRAQNGIHCDRAHRIRSLNQWCVFRMIHSLPQGVSTLWLGLILIHNSSFMRKKVPYKSHWVT